MKLSVVALDYDGTIASKGRSYRAALDAVRKARARGVAMILVTRRILSNLKRILPEHDLYNCHAIS